MAADVLQSATVRRHVMEMLLMGACLSLFGLAVTCLAFGAATRTEEPSLAAQHKPEVAKAAAAAPARFFVSPAIIPVAAHARVPLEALLLQIRSEEHTSELQSLRHL